MDLSLDSVRELTEQDIRKVKQIYACHKNIKHIDDLSPCLELQRLDISHNHLSSFQGIVDCRSLTWLNLSHNQLESLSGIQNLTNLIVLNASHNLLTRCGDLSRLTKLKALILNNNELTVIPGLNSMNQLNTLVLSHNEFELLDISSLTQLTKLSLANNMLHAVPDTQHSTELRELRLNSNKIMSLPSTLRNHSKLKVLDIGNNNINKFSDITVLSEMINLRNLNMKGNKLCNKEIYGKKMNEMFPHLNVLDGLRLTTFLKHYIKERRDGNARKRKLTDEEDRVVKRKVAMESVGETPFEKHKIDLLNVEDTVVHSTDTVCDDNDKLIEQKMEVHQEQKRANKGKRNKGKSGVVAVKVIRKAKRSITAGNDVMIASDRDVGSGGTSSWN